MQYKMQLSKRVKQDPLLVGSCGIHDKARFREGGKSRTPKKKTYLITAGERVYEESSTL